MLMPLLTALFHTLSFNSMRRHRKGFYGTVATTVAAFGLCAPAALADPADSYIGVGLRGGFNDETAAVIHAKLKVADFGEISLSSRPAVFLGNESEFRWALTGEGEIAPHLSPFLGGGLAINTDSSGAVDPMVSAGLDIQVAEHLVIEVGGNLIFEANDTDTELTTSVNYTF
jgi:hypothetical protein